MPLPYFLKASLAIAWKLVCSEARIGTGRLCKRLLQKFMGYNGGDLKYHGISVVKRDCTQDIYLKIKLTGFDAGWIWYIR